MTTAPERAGECDSGFLSPSHATRVYLGSVRFSQGSQLFQKEILGYLHKLRPQWRIDADQISEIRTQALNGALRFLGFPKSEKPAPLMHNPENITEEKVAFQVGEDIDLMRKVLEGSDTEYTGSASSIAFGIVREDLKFMTYGRVRAGMDPHHHSGDPWKSFTVIYALQGSPSGIAEFDQMFAEVNAFLRELQKVPTSSTLEWNVKKLVRMYNEKHPDSLFRWEDIYEKGKKVEPSV